MRADLRVHSAHGCGPTTCSAQHMQRTGSAQAGLQERKGPGGGRRRGGRALACGSVVRAPRARAVHSRGEQRRCSHHQVHTHTTRIP